MMASNQTHTCIAIKRLLFFLSDFFLHHLKSASSCNTEGVCAVLSRTLSLIHKMRLVQKKLKSENEYAF